MAVITIIGAGWLGKPLADSLVDLNHIVYASHTTPPLLQNSTGDTAIIHYFQCQLVGDKVSAQSDSVLTLAQQFKQQQCDVVIGCFPPGFRRGNSEQYQHYWQQLTLAAQQANVKKIIMVSSTTVYPNQALPMSEDKASLEQVHNGGDMFSDNARIMLQAEQYVIDSAIDYVIVRCSGLIGPNRHPARFVAKLKQVSTLAPANMLLLNDAIGILNFAITHIHNDVINATTPNTVDKAHFYQAALDTMGLDNALPKQVAQADKKIVAEKIQSLGYEFIYQHTLDAVMDLPKILDMN